MTKEQFKEQIKAHRAWEKSKDDDCCRHKALTAANEAKVNAMQNEITAIKATGQGIGLFWKALIGVASISGVLAAIWAKR